MKIRGLILPALLILTAVLCFYSKLGHPWIGLGDCLADTKACQGRMITKYQEPLIGEIYADGFELIQRRLPAVRVYADTTGLRTSEFVAMRAIFHEEGYLEAEFAVVQEKRRQKIWMSVLPVMLVFALLFRGFRFNLRKMQIEIRGHG